MAASEEQRTSHNTADEELEQYGVWVKAGPEDVDEAEAEDEAFALADLSDDELESEDLSVDTPSVDEALTEEDDFTISDDISLDIGEGSEQEAEHQETDPFSLEESEDEFESLSLDDDPLTSAEDLTLEDDDELLTIDDEEISFDMSGDAEELGLEPANVKDQPAIDAEPVDDDEHSLSLDELDLDDGPPAELESPDEDDEEDVDAGPAEIDIESDLPEDLDDLKLDIESLDVDSYGEAQTAESQSGPEDDFSLGDDLSMDDLSSEDDEVEEIELEDDDLDLSDLELGDEEESGGEVELDLSSLPDDDDEFGDLDLETSEDATDSELPELEAEDGVSLSLEEGFDDVSAVEDEMFADDTTAAAQPAGDAEDSALLAGIQSELSSIHAELGALKKELAQLRRSPAPTAPASTEEVNADQPGGGFFEEEADEDETIALTGDELDNIMNTAEFTEETGLPTDAEEFGIIDDGTPEESDESAGDELDLESLDDLPETAPVQEIRLDDAPDDLGAIEIELGADGTIPDEEEEVGEASEEQVDYLASMDIDAELADIDELEDTTENAPESHNAPTAEARHDEELVLDAEPLEDEILEADDSTDDTSLYSSDDSAGDFAATSGSLSGAAMPDMSALESDSPLPENLKEELRSVLSYMDQLLESLPEQKIREFAESEHFELYQKLFEELGIEQ